MRQEISHKTFKKIVGRILRIISLRMCFKIPNSSISWSKISDSRMSSARQMGVTKFMTFSDCRLKFKSQRGLRMAPLMLVVKFLIMSRRIVTTAKITPTIAADPITGRMYKIFIWVVQVLILWLLLKFLKGWVKSWTRRETPIISKTTFCSNLSSLSHPKWTRMPWLKKIIMDLLVGILTTRIFRHLFLR